MALLLVWLVILTAATTYADKCHPSVTIKRWQKHSPCAQRTALGVLIGYGYNLNLPHAKNDLAILGIDRNDIPKGIITQAYFECDCEKSVCLTQEQSQRLFDINVDRARKQVSSSISSTSTLCCDIQNALTGLLFTFGMEKVMNIQDFLTYANSKNWQKLGAALLKESWCKSSDLCKPLAERISEGCINVGMNLGCSPPTPHACDKAGQYCCAFNNTCCQYGSQKKKEAFFPSSNQAYWCCPLPGANCCPSSNSCCPKTVPVCCGGRNSCCYVNYPVCCFPGTPQGYCCVASSPVCLGNRICGSLDPGVESVQGKTSYLHQQFKKRF